MMKQSICIIVLIFTISFAVKAIPLEKSNVKFDCGVRYGASNLIRSTRSTLDELSLEKKIIQLFQLIEQAEKKVLNLLYQSIDEQAEIDKKINFAHNVIDFAENNLQNINNSSKKYQFLKLKLKNLKKILNEEYLTKMKKYLIKNETLYGSKISRIKGKVIGGTNAKASDFPWIVSLQTKLQGHFCGGTIIHPNWVLTASHCIVDQFTNDLSNEEIEIGVGNQFWQKTEKYKVSKMIKNNEFHHKHYKNDVALLFIDPAIKFSEGIRGLGSIGPICLPEYNQNIMGNATIAGWGLTKNNETSASASLMAADINVLQDEVCKKVYKNYVDDLMICAGNLNGGKDSCQGDSGGALQTVLKGKVVQIGVISFGDECGKANYPGVYAEVSALRNWIRKNTNNEV